MKNVVIINNDQAGHGDSELGQLLLDRFLELMLERRTLEAVVLYNGGVKLLAKGSPFIELFGRIIRSGVEVLPCKTCVDRFNIELGVGECSDALTIVKRLDEAAKVITF
jgi:intracellular sulfur oxidation DsrE/DsrF family protein